jgi:hypothetical protein
VQHERPQVHPPRTAFIRRVLGNRRGGSARSFHSGAVLSPDIAQHLLDLAHVRSLDLARQHSFHRQNFGTDHPNVGRLAIEIHLNNRAIAVLMGIVDGVAA